MFAVEVSKGSVEELGWMQTQSPFGKQLTQGSPEGLGDPQELLDEVRPSS